MRFNIRTLAILGMAMAAQVSTGKAGDYVFHHENLLGTSLELHVTTAREADARAAEAAALREIERLEVILSLWNPQSEASLALQAGGEREVSADLAAVLELCARWQQETGGAFNPGVAELARVWSEAEKRGLAPSTEELSQILPRMQQPVWRLLEGNRAAFIAGREVTLSAVAKAYIVDRAGTAAYDALAAPGSTLLLNIGGDLRQWGEQATLAEVTDPNADAENAPALCEVPLQNKALATSGGYRRGWTIGGVHHSHVIDPRTGQPVEQVASVTVMAGDTTTANALAVSTSVLGVEEGLRLVAGHPGSECLIVTPDGRQHRSAGWPAANTLTTSTADQDLQSEATGDPSSMEMVLSFEFPPASKRPYIAAWISDEDNFPVRTILLWIVQGGERLKWLPDLRVWYRDDKTRRLVDPLDLVKTRSSATRRAGNYSAIWNGLDDHSEPVAPGSYTLNLEAVREDGTHQIIKHPFDWNGKPFEADLPGNREITSARVVCAKAE